MSRTRSFLPGSNGDPRAVYDQYSGRWIVIVTDFSATESIFLAVSMSSDPTGSWFKTSFETDMESDAGCWPDYPTLGVDEHGIYSAAYMVGCGMSIFAIDKAPLVAPIPSLGTITAFRGFGFEGAIQPVHSYGNPPGQYFVSRPSVTTLRMHRIDGPLQWRAHEISEDELLALGIEMTATMRVRFTANDGHPQSITEAGVDGFCVTVLVYGDDPNADLDGDGEVGLADLAILLGAWGECPAEPPCVADFNGDGAVGSGDLAILLALWG